MTSNVDGLQVFGAIEEKWLSFGGLHGTLGRPVSNESPTFDGIGRFQNFQGGIISWSPRPEMGAHVVWGLIGERWLQIGREQFGYPLTDETPTPDGRGRFNHFRAFHPDGSLIGESSIYWLPETGAHEVYGAIRDFWAQHGWENGAVGYPVNAEHDRGNGAGREQQFQRGRIIWSPTTGAMFGRPHVDLHIVNDGGRFLQADGAGFSPGERPVRVDYGISAGSGPSTLETGTMTPVTRGDGSFTGRTRINLAGPIVQATARTTDVDTGAFVDAKLFN